MGSILKAIYSNTYKVNNERLILPNGLPKLITNYIEKQYLPLRSQSASVIMEEIKKITQFTNWTGSYDLGNFYYYFIHTHGIDSCITEDQYVEDDDITYLYPVEINTTIDMLFQSMTVNLYGHQVTYSFIDTLSEKVLDLLRQNRLKLMVCNIQDPCHTIGNIPKFEQILNDKGISEENLIYIFGNRFYNNTGSKTKFTYGLLPFEQQAVSLTNFPRMTSLGYISDVVREEDLDRNKLRPKKFLCFNRNLRNHRYYLAYMAIRHKLLDNSYFSFIVPHDSYENIVNEINNFVDNTDDESINKLKNFFPYEIDTQHLPGESKNGFVSDNNKKELYLNSYIHITSETSFFIDSNSEPFFSEKTLRPIANLQPFIFVGGYHSLKQLKSLGFKTFHPYIDESYDNEPDNIKRMNLIEQEILKLNSLTHKELHDLYYSMIDIVIYNRNHFLTFTEFDPYHIAYDEFKSL